MVRELCKCNMREVFENLCNKEHSGVSPVIGVILMVAITVILAAVIGTFVLGLGDSISQDANAGVTFEENVGTQEVEVQLNNIQSADFIWVETSDNLSGTDPATFTSSGSGFSKADSGPSNTEQYLLDSDGNGGAGTIVTYDYSGSDADKNGTLTVVGDVDGDTNVIQTYKFDG